MIQKWKTILTNWINCYPDETEKRHQTITLESLLTIFAQIHENLKLDDSDFSKLEVHAILDFIVEKYPEFKFENGTLEATNEDDVYIVASLLLFFICVNSKNEDIKRVMCSKLDVGDQETILMFSKCLMECSPVLHTDVEAAITEACGEDPSRQVAETPPALRSLHGEARRLQAALDAERFDRNYLQEELARTNLKLEKLTKDKEQYKLEILNLKAKISLCCGEQRESRNQARSDDSRLQRQLQELETQLENTQSQLEDVQDERDVYKQKVEELKQERDKWLSLSQEEATRATKLTDQLETERRTVQSLKDLVSELRQHNRNNALDASLLECDDPDASIHSLNNLSVCSEACANVIEVQLGEERAKIEVLKQQIQQLQDQLSEVGKRFESEKLALETVVSEKERDILDLKHRVNEVTVDKENLKAHYQQEFDTLSNKIADLEQKIRENEENSRIALQEKSNEIESMQQKFADDSKKSDNIIKNLKIELDAEKYAQLKLRDDFDTRLMKLNEKVLNRNNELVELQNKIILKSEMIECIQADLRKEKELRDELSNSCNTQLQKLNEQRIAIEHDMQQKCEELVKCQTQLQEKDVCIEKLNKEMKNLQCIVSNLEEKCEDQGSQIVEKQNEIEFINDMFQKEQENISHELDERNATVKSLQMQLQNEIDFKIQLQNQITELENCKMSLIEEINNGKEKCKAELLEKENMLDAMDMCLKQEKKVNEDLKQLCEKKDSELKENDEEICNMTAKMKMLEDQLKSEANLFEEELIKRDLIIESSKNTCNNQLLQLNEQKLAFENNIQEKQNEIEKCQRQLQEKEMCIEKINKEVKNLHISISNYKKKCQHLDSKITEKQEEIEFVNDMFQKEQEKLVQKVEECNETIKMLQTQLQNEIELKLQLQNQVFDLEKEKTSTNEHFKEICAEKDKELKELEEQLVQKKTDIKLLNEHYESEMKLFKEELKSRDDIIQSVNNKLSLVLQDKSDVEKSLNTLEDEKIKLSAKVSEKENEYLKLKSIYEKLCRDHHESKIRKNEFIELQKNNAMKNELIQLVQEDLKKEKEARVELSNNCNNLLLKLNEMEIVHEQKFEQIAKYEEQWQAKDVCIENLNKEVEDLVNTVSNLEGKCQSQKDTIIEKQKEIELLSEMLQKEQNQLALKVNEHNSAVKTFETQLQTEIEINEKYQVRLQEEATLMENLNKELERMQSSISNLEEECKSQEDTILKKQKEIELLQEEYKESNAAIKSFEAQLQIAIELNTKYQRQLQEEETRVEHLKKEIENLQSSASDLEEKCQSQEDTIAENQKETELLQEEQEQLKVKIDGYNAAIKSFEAQLQKEIDSNAEYQRLLQEKEICIENFNKEVENLQSSISNLEEKCKSQEDTIIKKQNEIKLLQEEQNKLALKIDEQNSVVKSLEVHLQEKETCIENLNKEVEYLQSSISNLEEKCLSENDRVMEKQKEIDLLQEEQKQLAFKVDEQYIIMKSIEIQLQQEIEFKAQLQNQITELETCKTSLMEAVNDLENKLKTDLVEKDNMLNGIDTCLKQEKKSNDELRQLYEEKDTKLKESLEDISKMKMNITLLEEQFQMETKLLKEELEKRDDIIQSSNSKVSLLLHEKADLEKSLNAVIDEKVTLLAAASNKDHDHAMLKTMYEKVCCDLDEKKNLNAELLELQDSITLKNEMIENIQSDLIKEKQLRDELSNTANSELLKFKEQIALLENDIQRKCEEISKLQEHLQEKEMHTVKLNKELENLQISISSLKDKCQIQESKIIEGENELKLVSDMLQKEQEKFAKKVEEDNTIMKSLQIQLQNEVDLKVELQNQVSELEASKMSSIIAVSDSENKYKADLLEKENMLDAIDICLKQEKKSNEDLKGVCEKRDLQIKKLIEEVAEKENKIKMLESRIETESKLFEEELKQRNDAIEGNDNKLLVILQEKTVLEKTLNDLNDDKKQLLNIISKKEDDFKKLNTAHEKLCHDHEEITHKLSQNKELIELRNSIITKNEEIERIQSDLGKERELRDILSTTCNNQLLTLNELKIAVDNAIQQKSDAIMKCQEQLEEKVLSIEKLDKEVENLQQLVSNLEQKCHNQNERIKEEQKIVEWAKDMLQKEQEKLALKVIENSETVKSLEIQLHNEINLKVKLESQVAQLEESLKETVKGVKNKSEADLLQKENINLLGAIDKCLNEENMFNEDLKEVCVRKDHEMKKLSEEISEKETKMRSIEDQLKTETKLFKEELVKRDGIIESANNKLSLMLQEKNDLQETLNTFNDEKAKLLAEACEKDKDNLILKNAYDKLCQNHHENQESLKLLEAKLNDAVKKNEDLQDINDKNTTRLLLKLEETENSIKKIHLQSKSVIDSKDLQIQTLMMEVANLQKQIESERVTSSLIKKERDALEVNKSKDVFFQNTLEEEYQKKCKVFEHKNEENAELKRQVMKMSATETRASQIIKVSAKYQAMILKRIAEIKSTAVLKELTNFGNTNTNGDSELRRSLTAGSVTMEDLENFLETTDRHLKRCSEKQIALQKDRDRLSEVNRINESEIINMNKFLTEMSVSFRTFTTVKEVYGQKLSKIVSIQRTVRRDILNLDGLITESAMCKLERGYAAVMQDLSECAMNIERWVDRSVSKMMSREKMQQAFASDHEPTLLSSGNYQNTSIEMQLSELENSFQKLLGEVGRAQRGEGARSAQEVTIMEVRAEYEDKLNRMKAKMKELFHEEMGRLKQKQAEEIAILERELIKSREKLADSSRAYEEHIRALTTELWSVGEKFLVKQEEADWLRKRQSGSLMSLQHIHSGGLHTQHEVIGRPSDTLSLRSLPVHNKKTESRALHMSDEEGEVFDNRFLKELSATPRASLAPGQRISELKRRNSLVPPHLKSSYPAELQFAPVVDEEDIKCASATGFPGRQQRKEVGITAYKKPGPPTPSKQAGRLSATDSELRESLRVEADPMAGRKTSTPSRIRSLFRSHRNDAEEGTPRSRRFSSIFRRK